MLSPGQVVWGVGADWDAGTFGMHRANFVRASKNGWVRVRNLRTGEEYSGRYPWFAKKQDALRDLLRRALLIGYLRDGRLDADVLQGLLTFLLEWSPDCYEEAGFSVSIVERDRPPC